MVEQALLAFLGTFHIQEGRKASDLAWEPSSKAAGPGIQEMIVAAITADSLVAEVAGFCQLGKLGYS